MRDVLLHFLAPYCSWISLLLALAMCSPYFNEYLTHFKGSLQIKMGRLVLKVGTNGIRCDPLTTHIKV